MKIDKAHIEQFINGYIEAMYFTDVNEDSDIPVGSELSDESWDYIRYDCLTFIKDNERTLYDVINNSYAYDATQAGRDYWFTRNGHGTGYWDRSLPERASKTLTQSATDQGTMTPYLGDDGFIWV